MTPFRKNIIANFAGNAWQAVMALAFIPFYIKFMGVEAYGLLGILATIQVVLSFLDMGLSNTLNREIARLSALSGQEQKMRNLVRSLEFICWGVALVIGMAVITLSSFIAHHWLQAGNLSAATLEQALVIMGLVLAFQWPAAFYSGGLRGLQRQIHLNVIIIFMSTLRGIGAVLVLWLVSPTIIVFFSWQIIVSTFSTGLLAWSLWKGLPTGNQKSSFDRKLLKGIWRFAAGMSGITVSALLLMQIDKVILSKIMSLENFGYYTLAGAMAGGLHIIIIPIYNSIFPRFSALAALHNDQVLIKLYHASTQLMAVLVLPAAMTLMVFSYDILLLWTGDSFISRNTAPLVSILTMGTAINALMVLPYTLQLAYGWTNISLKINIFLIVMMVPTIIILTNHYGPAGAASSWVILNVIYMLIGIPLTHSRLLKGEVKNWFNDFIYTFAVVLVTVLIGRYLFNNFISNISIILTVASVGLFSLFVAVLSSEHFRSLISLRILPGKSL